MKTTNSVKRYANTTDKICNIIYSYAVSNLHHAKTRPLQKFSRVSEGTWSVTVSANSSGKKAIAVNGCGSIYNFEF